MAPRRPLDPCHHCGADPVGRVTLRSCSGEVERHPLCGEAHALARSLGLRGDWESFAEVARGGGVELVRR